MPEKQYLRLGCLSHSDLDTKGFYLGARLQKRGAPNVNSQEQTPKEEDEYNHSMNFNDMISLLLNLGLFHWISLETMGIKDEGSCLSSVANWQVVAGAVRTWSHCFFQAL